MRGWKRRAGRCRRASSSAVPPALRTDPGYLFAHVQDARRSGRLDEALGWLKLAPSDPAKLVDPDKWWSERRMVARALIDRGAFDKAYAVCDAAVASSSPAKSTPRFTPAGSRCAFSTIPPKPRRISPTLPRPRRRRFRSRAPITGGAAPRRRSGSPTTRAVSTAAPPAIPSPITASSRRTSSAPRT